MELLFYISHFGEMYFNKKYDAIQRVCIERWQIFPQKFALESLFFLSALTEEKCDSTNVEISLFSFFFHSCVLRAIFILSMYIFLSGSGCESAIKTSRRNERAAPAAAKLDTKDSVGRVGERVSDSKQAPDESIFPERERDVFLCIRRRQWHTRDFGTLV
jgi:hypothetical protein